MISDTSLVTNMDVKKTPNIRKRERATIVFNLEASPMTGRRTFSFLNPSRTQSIIRSMPRVCQSMSFISPHVGGVIKSEMIAAMTARVSINSFFKNPSIFFKLISLSVNQICDVDTLYILIPFLRNKRSPAVSNRRLSKGGVNKIC